MKKGLTAAVLTLCLLLAGCGKAAGEADGGQPAPLQDEVGEAPAPAEEGEDTAADDAAEAAVETAEAVSGYPVFDFGSRTVKLNSGYEMPILGLGMFSLSDSQAENSTYWALKAGFRLIDTARIYGNEAAVGRGLRRVDAPIGRAFARLLLVREKATCNKNSDLRR